MKRNLVIGLFLLVGLALIALPIRNSSSAAPKPNDVVDIVGTSSSPAGTGSVNGSQQNWDVNTAIAPGGSFTVDISVSINANGNETDYPTTVNLAQGPGGQGTLAAISDCVFSASATPCTRTVTVTAPLTAGAKVIKVAATTHDDALSNGNGLNIHYTVSSPPPPPTCEPVATDLSVDALEIIYHQPSITLIATLTKTSDSSAIAGKTIRFEVDGVPVGTGVTDSNGIATYFLDTSSFGVGDHTIDAFYDGEDCAFDPDSGSASLCVSYGSVTFRPPISPTGPALFRSVKTIPVKIVVTDYYGVSVPDADAHVWFAKYSSNTNTYEPDVSAEALANTNGDNGNLMRYDPVAGQYIFNWNTSTAAGLMTEGKYRIHVILGEGSCAPARTAEVTFKRK